MFNQYRCFAFASIAGAMLLFGVAAGAQQTLPPSERQSYSGSDLFRVYCAACHGTSAHGDGPLAANMKRPPPDLTRFAAGNAGVFPAEMVKRIIDGRQPVTNHGGPDMPVWGDAFKASYMGASEESVQARINALVEFIETIQERQSH